MIVRLVVPAATAALYPFCTEWVVIRTGGVCHAV